ncbi:MAG: hypothetical protein E7316_05505 [Clostridiales bacterium]|nr:hypothetical protein [Clostridiales bacterium]
MGSFANSMFSVLLGWFSGAVDWVWNVLFQSEDGGLIGWIGENWLGLIIGLSLICMAVDLLVHLLRWQPHKVWASFFRRISGKTEDAQDTGGYSARMRREWHYADGTARTEEIDLPDEEWQTEDQPPARVSSADMPQQYVQAFARPENLHYQEELKKEQPVGLEDYPQPRPAQEEPIQRGTRAERLRKRMARLSARLDDDDELELRYRPVPPAMDKREAYHEPYIPPQWKKPANTGAANEEEPHDNAF